jgi:hypothetical protein
MGADTSDRLAPREDQPTYTEPVNDGTETAAGSRSDGSVLEHERRELETRRREDEAVHPQT